jgi:prepilin-type processing-associated H-X9-DG protein/prepilin-type N-terminal cleavage/methylation domain-containing protein
MCERVPNNCRESAMTLIELLVVIAMIALLAALLLPVLGSAKAKGRQAACLDNVKQLQLAFQMYASDNGGKLPQNVALLEGLPATLEVTNNSWVYGNVKNVADATNVMLIHQGELYPYLLQPAVYHCPADTTTDNGKPRTRSYAMNAWIGSPEMEQGEYLESGYRVFLKESDIAAVNPAALFVFIDEHALTLADGWFEVTMTDIAPFIRFPATRHQNGYNLSFADGHVETFHLRDPASQVPETQADAFLQPPALTIKPQNPDWIRLKQVTTVR